MPVLYREDLEELQMKGCSNPKCDCHNEGLLFMHSKCHPKSPTQTYFEDGMLTIMCAECREVIIQTIVPERYPQ
jgi:ribosomal protein S27E